MRSIVTRGSSFDRLVETSAHRQLFFAVTRSDPQHLARERVDHRREIAPEPVAALVHVEGGVDAVAQELRVGLALAVDGRCARRERRG